MKWRHEWVLALDEDVYQALIDWINEEAAEQSSLDDLA